MRKLLTFNESDSYFNAKSIIENIKDICTELEDEDIEYRIEPSNDIRIKMLGLYINNTASFLDKFRENSYGPFFIEITVPKIPVMGSKIQTIINTFSHLENYLTTEGLGFKYKIFHHTNRGNKNIDKISNFKKEYLHEISDIIMYFK